METPEQDSLGVKTITRMDIYNIIQQQDASNINEKLNLAEQFLENNESYSEQQRAVFKQKMAHFKNQFSQKWSAVHRKRDLFTKKFESWLQGSFEIPSSATKSDRPGRPEKSFEESSERSKRRKTEKLRKNADSEEIICAAQMEFRSSGKRDAARVLQEINESPKQATKYRKAYSNNLDEKRQKLSPLKALSIFVEAGLTRQQYEIIRTSDSTFWPCYSVLQAAKKSCYPLPESFEISSTSAEINLKDLLDHTAARLILYLDDVIETLSEEERGTMQLLTKWGCGGSQQAQYKQKFENSAHSDANIFQSSLVPLRLVCGANKKIVWQNPSPSSPRYCRPIRIRFIKETNDVTSEEIAYIQNKIRNLQPTKLGDINIDHCMMLTMVDGKVCNAATGTTSTMRCYICGATSKQMNNLEEVEERNVDESVYSFVLSILHSRIRFFEALLHLSYKLPIKKWQKKLDNDEKLIIEERKKKIQEEFRSKMGIIVDVPKPGFGSTNDGNTSRTFFSYPELSSEITGINVDLIKRLKVILEVIASGHKIDTEKFAIYAMDTAKLYVELYPWCPMTPTLHKVLIHGPAIIESALLPIGQLSEEAAEARNKHFRSYRLNYARKFFREACNRDIINRLLLTSDPFITSIRPRPKKKLKPFSKEALELLLPDEDRENVELYDEEEGDI